MGFGSTVCKFLVFFLDWKCLPSGESLKSPYQAEVKLLFICSANLFPSVSVYSHSVLFLSRTCSSTRPLRFQHRYLDSDAVVPRCTKL